MLASINDEHEEAIRKGHRRLCNLAQALLCRDQGSPDARLRMKQLRLSYCGVYCGVRASAVASCGEVLNVARTEQADYDYIAGMG